MTMDRGIGAAIDRLFKPGPREQPIGTLSPTQPINAQRNWLQFAQAGKPAEQITVAPLPTPWFQGQRVLSGMEPLSEVTLTDEYKKRWMQFAQPIMAEEPQQKAEAEVTKLPEGWTKDASGNYLSSNGFTVTPDGEVIQPDGMIRAEESTDTWYGRFQRTLQKASQKKSAETLAAASAQEYEAAMARDLAEEKKLESARRLIRSMDSGLEGRKMGDDDIERYARTYVKTKSAIKEPIISALSWLDRKLQNPFENATVFEAMYIQTKGGDDLSGLDEREKKFFTQMLNIRKTRGAGAVLWSPEAAEVYDEFRQGATGIHKVLLTGMEWSNPVFMLPVGKGLGWAASKLAPVPILGKTAQIIASGVQKAEALPGEVVGAVLKPVKEAATEALAKARLSANPHALTKLDDMVKAVDPEYILKDLTKENWQKAAVQKTADRYASGKLRKAAQNIFGVAVGVPETGAARISEEIAETTLKDIVERGFMVKANIAAIGRNMVNVQKMVLKSISANPKKLFQMEKQQAISHVPQISEKATGTLEDVFTHPEYYRLNDRQVQYINAVKETQDIMFDFARRTGIDIKDVGEDYFHRVVTGYEERVGDKVMVYDAKTKSRVDRPRDFESQAEGIMEGYRYNPNPEVAVVEYMEQIWNRVANKKVGDYFDTFGLGKTPLEALIEKQPGLQEKWLAAKAKSVEARKFYDVVNRSLRGENIPTGTLKELRDAFPEMTDRLNALLLERTEGQSEIMRYLSEMQKNIRFFKKTKPENLEQAFVKLDNRALAETFKMFRPSDRVALRETLKEQFVDLERLASESEGRKLAGVQKQQEEMKRILKVLDDVDGDITNIQGMDYSTTMGIPEPVAAKSTPRPITLPEYEQLDALYKKNGMMPPDFIVGPEGTAQMFRNTYELPSQKSLKEWRAEVRTLRDEARSVWKDDKDAWVRVNQTRNEEMTRIRLGGLKENYIRIPPSLGGKLYPRRFIDEVNKWFGHEGEKGIEKGNAVLRYTADSAGILTRMKASMDLGFHAIQGVPAFALAHANLVTNPVQGGKMLAQWYKAFGISAKSAFHPERGYKYIAENRAQIEARNLAGGSTRAVDMFEHGGTGFGTFVEDKILGKAPLNPYARAEMAFLMGGEVLRNEFWKLMAPKALANGQERELARMLDRMTGIWDSKTAGIPLTQRQLERSVLFFAPQYTRAGLSLVADIFKGGMSGREAKKMLGGLIAAGGVYYTATQYALATIQGKSSEEAWESVTNGFGVRYDPVLKETTWKPGSDFMAVKVGNYNIGVGGFWYGLLRLSGNVVQTVNRIGEGENVNFIALTKDGVMNRDNPLLMWWYNRSSPLTGAGVEAFTHRDFLGNPLETKEQYAAWIAQLFMPIGVEQGVVPMTRWAKDNEVPEGLARQALIPSQLLGLRNVPISAWGEFYDRVKQYAPNLPESTIQKGTNDQTEAWRKGKLGWAQLTKEQQQWLLKTYPDLDQAYSEAQTASEVMQSPLQKEYNREINEKRAATYGSIKAAWERVQRGELSMKEYRAAYASNMTNYAAGLQMTNENERYKPVLDFLNEMSRLKLQKYDYPTSNAYVDYLSNVVAADFTDDAGIYDYQKREAAIASFIERWGPDKYADMQEIRRNDKDGDGMDPLALQYMKTKEDLDEYWKLPAKPIASMTLADKQANQIPADKVGIWQAYQDAIAQASTQGNKALKATKETWQKQYPDLFVDERAEYRKSHAEQDALLGLFDYGGEIKTYAAYEQALKLGQQFNIPIGQTKLGKLPPPNIAEQYFDYYALEDEVDQILFKREHPEFNRWAMEKLGHVNAWNRTFEGPTDKNLRPQWKAYQELENTQERNAFRAKNHELNAWMMREKGYKPLKGPSDSETLKVYYDFLELKTEAQRNTMRQQYPKLNAYLVHELGWEPLGGDILKRKKQ